MRISRKKFRTFFAIFVSRPSYKGLQGLTRGYKVLQGGTRGFKRLQKVRRGEKGLEGLQGVTSG